MTDTPQSSTPQSSERQGVRAGFWDDKFADAHHLFGTAPNAFIRREAHRIAPGSEVLELGAGEGRNAVYLARQGHTVTVVDFSTVAVALARGLAERAQVSITTVEADVAMWVPDRQWDAVVASFLHLPPDNRPRLWGQIDEVTRPGGWFIGVFFRPEQRTEGYTSGGPPDASRMVPLRELEAAFAHWQVDIAQAPVETLDDGFMQGPAALVYFAAQKP